MFRYKVFAFSQFQLSEKPRCMEKSDEISALGLTAYSVRGSPMTVRDLVNMNDLLEFIVQLLSPVYTMLQRR